jgi:hypothetical protein
MAIVAKPRAAAAIWSAVIVAVGLIASANAQQPPAAGSAPPQAQPGPTMGADMMQRGMERGRMGMGMGMGQDMMGPGMMDGPMMSAMMGAGAQHMEGRLAFIKAELRITDAQMPQWNAFADAVRATGSAMSDMHRSMASQRHSGATLPERLAMEDKVLSAHVAAFKKVQEAVTKLYEVLGPEQKKVADGIVLGPMGMPMGMM